MWKVIALGIIALLAIYFIIDAPLYFLQKFINRKAPKIIWIVPGIFLAATYFFTLAYYYEEFLSGGCGKQINLLYAAIWLLGILLPTLYLTKKLIKERKNHAKK